MHHALPFLGSINRRLVSAIVATALLSPFSLPYVARGEILGKAFSGINGYNPTDKGGGYFLYEPNKLPVLGTLFGIPAANYYQNLPAAIDNSLTDNIDPAFITLNYVQVLNFGGGSNRVGIRVGPEPAEGPFYNYFGEGAPYGLVPLHTVLDLTRHRSDVEGQTAGRAGWGFDIVADRWLSIADAPLKTFRAEDIFTNPRSIGFGSELREPFVNGHLIKAQFTPHINVNGVDVAMKLDDVAMLLGVKSFNWVQTIDTPGGSNGLKVEIWDNDLVGLAPKPYLDPIPTLGQYYVLTNESGQTASPDYGNLVPDGLPFYYNVGFGGPGTTPTALAFQDSPALPKGFVNASFTRTFHTELVGVYEDGSYIYTGLGFTWKSDAVHEGGGAARFVAYDSVNDPSVVPPIISGGVFDVQVFYPVPEPSSLTLAVLALVIGASIAVTRART